MVDGLKRNNKKIWSLVFAGLMLLIVGLVVAIVVVNITHEAEIKEAERIQKEKEAELGNEATKQCNAVNASYDEGAISLDIAKQYFENALADNDDVMFKTYVASCYARFVYDAGDGIDAAVVIMDRLELWLDNESVLSNYYTVLRDLYRENGSMGEVEYYDDLLYEMNNSEEKQ